MQLRIKGLVESDSFGYARGLDFVQQPRDPEKDPKRAAYVQLSNAVPRMLRPSLMLAKCLSTCQNGHASKGHYCAGHGERSAHWLPDRLHGSVGFAREHGQAAKHSSCGFPRVRIRTLQRKPCHFIWYQ